MICAVLLPLLVTHRLVTLRHPTRRKQAGSCAKCGLLVRAFPVWFKTSLQSLSLYRNGVRLFHSSAKSLLSA